MEYIVFELVLAIFGNLAERHHIAGIGAHQLSLLDGSTRYQSLSFSKVDQLDCYRKSQFLLFIYIKNFLVCRTEALKIWVVKRVNCDPLMKIIVHTVLLLAKIGFDLLYRNFLCFRDEWL